MAACAVVAGTALAAPASAQRTNENAVTSAEDAFGTGVGNEAIGIYGEGRVRGFSPTVAGNIRIDGLFFDQQAGLTNRVRSGSAIRVGPSAQGFPFPAPTGVVDISLRRSGPEPILSAIASYGPYGSVSLELDGQTPIAGPALTANIGVGVSRDRFANGGSGTFTTVGAVPRWRPNDALEVVGFWGRSDGFEETAPPAYIPAGDFVPPRVQRGRYKGPRWAAYNGHNANVGATLRYVTGDWTIRAGAFRSVARPDESYANLLLDIGPERTTDRLIFANPASRYASTSGEVRVSRGFSEGDRKHLLLASYRLRRVESRYGGSDSVVVRDVPLEEKLGIEKPMFEFGEQSRDSVRQDTIGISYGVIWEGLGQATVGVQRVSYGKVTRQPSAEIAPRDEQRLFPTAAASLDLARGLVGYASYTQGLEETGTAPNNAVNRLELLPAIVTEQWDAGLSWRPNARLNLIAGYFDISKPYLALSEDGVFRQLGAQANRGLELSASWRPSDRLTIVAGAVVSRPRVTGTDQAANRIGSRPVGRAGTIAQLNADWIVPGLEGISLDTGLSYTGARTATVSNSVVLGGFARLDVGGRYRFKLAGSQATLRVSVANVMNRYEWVLLSAGIYEPLNQRGVDIYLAVDF